MPIRSVNHIQYDLSSDPVATELVKSAFTGGGEVQIRPSSIEDEWEVVAENGRAGHLIRTSPQSDNITGFSGPTDCLVALDNDYRIVSVDILSSRDTVEHVDLVEDAREFFSAFSKMSAAESSWSDIDAVSGATLTSYAIVASVAQRISGRQPALKFAAEPTMKRFKYCFPRPLVCSQRLNDQCGPSLTNKDTYWGRYFRRLQLLTIWLAIKDPRQH